MKIFSIFHINKNFANDSWHFFATFLCLVLLSVELHAQEFNMNAMPPPDVQISYPAGTMQVGTQVTIGVTIPDNWHVNANVVADEFLKPSSVDIAARGIVFGAPIWPAPIKEYNEILDMENLVFKGYFEIKIPVDSLAADSDSLTTNVTFHYQACDNSICLAPAEVSVSMPKGNIPSLKKNGEEVGNGEGTPGATPETPAASNEEPSYTAIALLLFAFLGGMILNLMPCVLPVLSLKLFSLISEAGESRKRLMALGFSTTFGVLVSFWVLAAIISIIRIGGGNAGWGMQFQSSGFIAFMVAILAAFAMSFFGVFEVWLPGSATTKMDAASHKQGLAGAFFTGALLVLLSTPCSAPFLGTAMGFAFTASTPVLFLFFTAAGLGLSLPYLLVSIFPKVLNVLPKPGKWMVTLQKVMGVLLLGTVGWLLWIGFKEAGLTGSLLLGTVAVVSIIAAFLAGKFAQPGMAFKNEVLVFGGSIIVIAALWLGELSPMFEAQVDARFNERMQAAVLEDGWIRYTPELIENLEKQGKTVFIDVTADWCLTCKANEAAVLGGKEFTEAMDQAGVVRVKADWTRETPEVNELLKSMGKSGVPAYAIYPKGKKAEQIVLPELLTTNGILENIK